MVYRLLKKEYVQSPEPDSLTHHIWPREVRRCCQKNLESHQSEAQPTRTEISTTRTWTHSKKTRTIKQARLREKATSPIFCPKDWYEWSIPVAHMFRRFLHFAILFRVIFFWCISEHCSESGLQLKTTEMWQGFLSFLFDIWHVHVMFSCIMAPLKGPIPAQVPSLLRQVTSCFILGTTPGLCRYPHWSCSRLPLHIVVLISLLRLVIMVCVHFSVDSIKSISSFYT